MTFVAATLAAHDQQLHQVCLHQLGCLSLAGPLGQMQTHLLASESVAVQGHQLEACPTLRRTAPTHAH